MLLDLFLYLITVQAFICIHTFLISNLSAYFFDLWSLFYFLIIEFLEHCLVILLAVYLYIYSTQSRSIKIWTCISCVSEHHYIMYILYNTAVTLISLTGLSYSGAHKRTLTVNGFFLVSHIVYNSCGNLK